MKDINHVIFKDIVYNFKRITSAIQPDEEIFMLFSGHGMIKQALLNGFSNIGLAYTMLKRGLTEPDVNVHV
jgi:hypothetical protein